MVKPIIQHGYRSFDGGETWESYDRNFITINSDMCIIRKREESK